jgi:hypothetical protein
MALVPIRAFSSEVDTGSHEENASNQNHKAPLLIPSEAEGSKDHIAPTSCPARECLTVTFFSF